MRTRMFLYGFCGLLVAATARAHGPQMQVTNDVVNGSNKIVTREIIPAPFYGNSLTSEKSVYVMPILKSVSLSPAPEYWTVMPNSSIDPILNISASAFGPGLTYGYGHTFAAGEHFVVNFIGPLLKWNGSTFIDNPGLEEIGGFRGDNQTSADTAFTNGPVTQLVFGNISATYNGESHSSMRFRVLGDGASATVEPSDGVYLFKYQISSTQPGLSPSDVVSLVLNKNANSTALTVAVASLGADPLKIQYIAAPEPTVAVLLLCGVATFITFRRSRPCTG